MYVLKHQVKSISPPIPEHASTKNPAHLNRVPTRLAGRRLLGPSARRRRLPTARQQIEQLPIAVVNQRLEQLKGIPGDLERVAAQQNRPVLVGRYPLVLDLEARARHLLDGPQVAVAAGVYRPFPRA